MAIHFDNALQRNMTRKVIIETSLCDTLIFLLLRAFRNFYMEIECVQGCRVEAAT